MIGGPLRLEIVYGIRSLEISGGAVFVNICVCVCAICAATLGLSETCVSNLPSRVLPKIAEPQRLVGCVLGLP